MRRNLFCVGIVFCVAALTGANFLITQVQSEVVGKLDELGLEVIPSKLIGGTQTYKVTDATIEKLEQMKTDGTAIEVEAGLPNSGIVQAAMKALKLVEQPREDGETGDTFKFDVTDATIKHLKGKKVEVVGTGKVKVK